jgi:hypothetical protein
MGPMQYYSIGDPFFILRLVVVLLFWNTSSTKKLKIKYFFRLSVKICLFLVAGIHWTASVRTSLLDRSRTTKSFFFENHQ